MIAPTPGQTVGPFFHYGLEVDGGEHLVAPGTPGSVVLHGRVVDGEGAPVPDALLEIWQHAADGAVPRADGSLRRDGWSFTGFGRTSTRPDGTYSFTTMPPGVDADGHAPFFAMTVFARGLLNRLFTRVYLPDDAERLGRDPLLSSLDPTRRSSMIAAAETQGYVFDVCLQGPVETVFLSFDGDR